MNNVEDNVPMRRTTFHGTFSWTICQFNRPLDGLQGLSLSVVLLKKGKVGFLGITNMRKIMNTHVDASVTLLIMIKKTC